MECAVDYIVIYMHRIRDRIREGSRGAFDPLSNIIYLR